MITPPVDDVDLETDKFFQLLQWSISNDEDDDEQELVVKRAVGRCCDVQYIDGQPTESMTPSSPEDSIDGGWFGGATPECTVDGPRLTLHTSEAYDKKSADEQAELHKYIARQLDQIAKEVEMTHGPKPVSVSDLVSVPDYEKFASTISAALGSDASVRQLALFYQLSRDVMAAVTGDTSKNVSGWIKTYFREKIAPWVVRNRGLESCVAGPVSETDESQGTGV